MITSLQRAVARIFFGLPESMGFAVAGGAALIARDLVDRETRDVDLVTGVPPTALLPDTAAAFEHAPATTLALFGRAVARDFTGVRAGW